MKTKREIEMKALLDSSGEAQLTDAERQATAAWREDLEWVTTAAQSACSQDLPPTLKCAHLSPQNHAVIKAQRIRFQRFRMIKRLAAAASLIVVTGVALLRYNQIQQQARLERLGTVLFLLENTEDYVIDGEAVTDTVTLESLAEQLREMQYANN